jgi:hypothetical protein
LWLLHPPNAFPKDCIPVSALFPILFQVLVFAGGIILPLVLAADVMASSGDPFAFIVMFVALTIVFL